MFHQQQEVFNEPTLRNLCNLIKTYSDNLNKQHEIEINSEAKLRNFIIEECSRYLKVSHGRFFGIFGRHGAKEKRMMCKELIDSGRNKGIDQLISKIVEAIDFFQDKIDWQDSLEEYKEELLFLSQLQCSTTNNASGIVQNHRFGHAPLTL